MNNFVMLVGLPASGKSKFASHFKDYNYIIHSSDVLREELYGDESLQIDNEKLFQELHRRIKADLKAGKDVIYDATNISRKRRTGFLQEIKRYEKVAKKCVFFATDYQTCVDRDQLRDRTVGEAVIKRMYEAFWIPQMYEGWDHIEIQWSYKNSEHNIIEKLDELKDFNQDTPYHEFTLDKHVEKVCEFLVVGLIMRGEFVSDNYPLMLAAQLHDIGKPFTKSFDAEKGHSTYYQHQLVGGYQSLFLLKNSDYRENLKNNSDYFLGHRGLTEEEILETVALIQWHMYPYSIEQKSTRKKLIGIVGQEFYEKLMILHDSDRAAH